MVFESAARGQRGFRLFTHWEEGMVEAHVWNESRNARKPEEGGSRRANGNYSHVGLMVSAQFRR
jgi:hypothetical protein